MSPAPLPGEGTRATPLTQFSTSSSNQESAENLLSPSREQQAFLREIIRDEEDIEPMMTYLKSMLRNKLRKGEVEVEVKIYSSINP